MKLLLPILLISISSYCQDSTIQLRFTGRKWEIIKGESLGAKIVFGEDSVKATVLKTSENTLVFKVGQNRFISYDCKCSLKRGDVFYIPKNRFDSLLKEAKPVMKKDIEN